jgi:hypothetical protein
MGRAQDAAADRRGGAVNREVLPARMSRTYRELARVVLMSLFAASIGGAAISAECLVLAGCYRDVAVPQRIVRVEHVPTPCVSYRPPEKEKPVDCLKLSAFDCDLAQTQWQLRQLERLEWYVVNYVLQPCFGEVP